MSDVLISVRGDSGVLHKITKICSYASNGFSMITPYHSAGTGMLVKRPNHPDGLTTQIQSLGDMVSYSAHDRVKLSLHFSGNSTFPGGFAQFSGVRGGRITSGRDPETGRPRGVGLVASDPIVVTTGPLCFTTFWGLEDFERLTRLRKRVLVFEEEDIYAKNTAIAGTQRSYLMEFHMFPRCEYDSRCSSARGDVFIKLMPNYFSVLQIPFAFRVIDLPGQEYFLGCLLWRQNSEFPARSGFVMNGPTCKNAETGVEEGIAAMYPGIEGAEADWNLDRNPGVPSHSPT